MVNDLNSVNISFKDSGSQANLSFNSKENKSNNLHIPVVVCIWSQHNNTESFKGILMEIYNIIHKKKFTFSNFSEDILNNFRIIELINLSIFITGVASPPYYSNMNLNLSKKSFLFLDFSQVDYYTSSKYELPNCDMNIKLLLDSLETSIIIKLWCGILTEKQVKFIFIF